MALLSVLATLDSARSTRLIASLLLNIVPVPWVAIQLIPAKLIILTMFGSKYALFALDPTVIALASISMGFCMRVSFVSFTAYLELTVKGLLGSLSASTTALRLPDSFLFNLANSLSTVTSVSLRFKLAKFSGRVPKKLRIFFR